jgi:hypothetical protein
MSNLKDLFISQSFFGIINLENSTQPITSQSGDIQLQDGIGTNLGIFINASTKDVTISNKLNVDDTVDIDGDLDVVGNIYLSGSWIHTGSIDVKGDVTVDGNVSANIATFDTVNTRLLHVTEESASVIFSSGSNILGDENTDTQTLNGSVYIPFKEFLKGNVLDTDTRINQKQNSGSFNAYTQSTDIRLNNIESFTSSQENINSGYNSFTESVDNKFTTLQSYTASVDNSLSSLNAFTSSQISINSGYNSFTQSADGRLTNIELTTASLDNSVTLINAFTSSTNQRLTSIEAFTSSLSFDFVEKTEFNTYTASVDSSLSSINSFTASADVSITALNVYTASQDVHNSAINNFTASQQSHNSAVNTFTASAQSEIDNLVAATGSYARTDIGNTFNGTQVFSGSVGGDVHSITVASQTASIDCSLGNFFTLEQATGTNYLLKATNIAAGKTITLRVNKTNPAGTISIDTGSIKFPSGFSYEITPGDNKQDVVTFVSFDNSSLYAVASKNFV